MNNYIRDELLNCGFFVVDYSDSYDSDDSDSYDSDDSENDLINNLVFYSDADSEDNIKKILLEIDFTEFSQRPFLKNITKSKYNYLIPNELKIEICKQINTTELLFYLKESATEYKYVLRVASSDNIFEEPIQIYFYNRFDYNMTSKIHIDPEFVYQCNFKFDCNKTLEDSIYILEKRLRKPDIILNYNKVITRLRHKLCDDVIRIILSYDELLNDVLTA